MLTASKKLQLVRYINSARDSQRDFLTVAQDIIDRHDADGRLKGPQADTLFRMMDDADERSNDLTEDLKRVLGYLENSIGGPRQVATKKKRIYGRGRK